MKKVLFVLALVVAYGLSVSTASAKVVKAEKAKVTVVADLTDNVKAAPEGEKEKEKAKSKEAKASKSEGCAKAKSEGCAAAKSEGCSGKAKSECGSGCAEKKSKETK